MDNAKYHNMEIDKKTNTQYTVNMPQQGVNFSELLKITSVKKKSQP